MDENTNIIMEGVSIPAGIRIPKEKFYEFYPQFNKVSDIVDHKDWNIWSQFYEFEDNELEIEINQSDAEIEAIGNDPERVQEEIIKCADSFFYFCHKYVKIIHPVFGKLPCVLYKYQRRVIKDYEDNRFTILSKFRQGGLTMIACLWGLWRCMFKLEQQILLMSRTDREALAAGDIAKFALLNLPSWLKPELSEDSKHEKKFADTSSVLKFYTPEAARGKSMTILVVDEAAFIQGMDSYWKDMYPIIATGGKCVVISTVNGIGNWYERKYHDAQRKENEFHVIDLDFWEHPDYVNPEWAQQTRANMGEKGFAQEILRSFLGSGETYIPARVIAELDGYTRDNTPLRIAFANWKNVGENEYRPPWENGALWIWKEPRDGHEYIIGVDCAEGVGEGGDNNCFQIIDMGTLEQVAEFYSNICPPNVYSQIIHEIGYFYNTALVVVENNGVGAAITKSLQHDLAYENLYYDSKKKGNAIKMGIQVGVANRPVLLEALQHRLVNSTLKINSSRLTYELNTFIYNAQKKRAEARRGRHDDAIMAICIALHVRDSQIYDVPIGAEMPEEVMQIFKADVFQEIKEEILRNSPEDWIKSQDTTPESDFFSDDEGIVPGVMFDIRRANEDLLREFGW